MVISMKNTYTVKPAEETPTCVMYLSDFDHVMSITHTPTIYFYRRPESSLNELQILKHSLSRALSIFYPLAGRLRWTTDPSRRRLEINCNAAGALLIEAKSDSVVNDFGDFCPTDAVVELVPSIDYSSVPIDEQPLLLVQLTKFSCGGLSLGLRVSHILVDGEAASHFISEWAQIARGVGPTPQNVPFLDREVLKPPEIDSQTPLEGFDVSEYFKKTPLIIGQADDWEERTRPTMPAMFKLSKDQVETLRNKANKLVMSRAFTRYEAVSAHLWKCVCKAREHQDEQETALRVIVNFRNRMKPNLPQFYFGNAVVAAAATTTARELLAEPLSDTCIKIREAVNKVDDDYLKTCQLYLKNEKDLARFRHWHVVGSEEGAFFGNPNLSLPSWTSLPLYGTDFGWGRDIYMGPGLLGYDGKSVMIPGREEGSLVIALRLQVDYMDAFKKSFYDDIVGNWI